MKEKRKRSCENCKIFAELSYSKTRPDFKYCRKMHAYVNVHITFTCMFIKFKEEVKEAGE